MRAKNKVLRVLYVLIVVIVSIVGLMSQNSGTITVSGGAGGGLDSLVYKGTELQSTITNGSFSQTIVDTSLEAGRWLVIGNYYLNGESSAVPGYRINLRSSGGTIYGSVYSDQQEANKPQGGIIAKVITLSSTTTVELHYSGLANMDFTQTSTQGGNYIEAIKID